MANVVRGGRLVNVPTEKKKKQEYTRYLQAPKAQRAEPTARQQDMPKITMQKNDRYYNGKHASNYNPRIMNSNSKAVDKLNTFMARSAQRALDEKVWASPKRSTLQKVKDLVKKDKKKNYGVAKS